ncbi:MAG TPA: BamA/TamA family outer membrane protein [Kofleriaceae bacterium]|nr:BamA/TamA family outer membrane protein [Kofleriaceae bacterium]
MSAAARLLTVAIAATSAAAGAARAQPPPGTAPATPEPPPPEPAPEPPPPGTTTDVWREPTPPLDLAYHVLDLPEFVVELALTPLAFTVGLVQRYRVDKRVYDLLRNDEGTIKVVPNAKFSGGEGFGVGAALELDNLLEREEELSIGGLIRLDRDYETRVRYRQKVARLEGREVSAEVHYELDQNLKYYGIGNDTEKSDERVIEERALDVEAAMDILSGILWNGGGKVAIGYRRNRLAPGVDTGVMPTPPLGEPGDTVVPTADFDRTYHDYARGAISLYRDTRDRIGRSTTGTLTELDLGVSAGLDQADLGAATMRGNFTGFFPLLPLYRVLVLSAGGAAVGRLTNGDSVPLRNMVLLDRKHGLRGYSTGRFRDQFGWWASAEYRYPIWEYQDTGVAMSPALFVDAGQVGGRLQDLVDAAPRWSVGTGLRVEHETRLIMVVEIGFSPEGYEVGFNLGKDL